METEYAASKPKSSSSKLWGLLFLAWMLSDSAANAKADTAALRADVASLRQSMTAEELQYAQAVSMQEGWEFPGGEISTSGGPALAATSVTYSDVPAPSAVSEQASAARANSPFSGPLEGFLGTSDPFEAIMKLAGMMFPLSALMIFISILRSVTRN